MKKDQSFLLVAAILLSASHAHAADVAQINLPSDTGDTAIDCVETKFSPAAKPREFWVYYSNDKVAMLGGGIGDYWPGPVSTTSGKGPDSTFHIESAQSPSGEIVYRFGFNAPGLLGGDGAAHYYGYGEIHLDPHHPEKTRVTGAEISLQGPFNLIHKKIGIYAGEFSCQIVHPSQPLQDCMAHHQYTLVGWSTEGCYALWDQESYRQSHLDTNRTYMNY